MQIQLPRGNGKKKLERKVMITELQERLQNLDNALKSVAKAKTTLKSAQEDMESAGYGKHTKLEKLAIEIEHEQCFIQQLFIDRLKEYIDKVKYKEEEIKDTMGFTVSKVTLPYIEGKEQVKTCETCSLNHNVCFHCSSQDKMDCINCDTFNKPIYCLVKHENMKKEDSCGTWENDELEKMKSQRKSCRNCGNYDYCSDWCYFHEKGTDENDVCKQWKEIELKCSNCKWLFENDGNTGRYFFDNSIKECTDTCKKFDVAWTEKVDSEHLEKMISHNFKKQGRFCETCVEYKNDTEFCEKHEIKKCKSNVCSWWRGKPKRCRNCYSYRNFDTWCEHKDEKVNKDNVCEDWK